MLSSDIQIFKSWIFISSVLKNLATLQSSGKYAGIPIPVIGTTPSSLVTDLKFILPLAQIEASCLNSLA